MIVERCSSRTYVQHDLFKAENVSESQVDSRRISSRNYPKDNKAEEKNMENRTVRKCYDKEAPDQD